MKKVLLCLGFVAIATLSHAFPVTIDCGGGKGTIYEAEGDTLGEIVDDALAFADWYC